MTFPTTPTPTVPSAESLRLSGSASSPLSLEPAGRGPSVVGVVGTPVVEVVVVGTPRPQGSTRSFRSAQTGRVVTTHARATTVVWRSEVAAAAAAARGDAGLLDGPVAVELVFVFARPRGHYGSGSRSGVLRPSAPATHGIRPDVDKLARAVLDALTGTVWRDDGQVAELSAHKVYGSPERCEVRVWQLDGAPDSEPDPGRVQLALDDGDAGS